MKINWNKILGLLDRSEPNYAPDIIEYGHGYQGRKLSDGRYVLEKKFSNRVIDLKDFSHSWSSRSVFYSDCTAKDAHTLDILAKLFLAGKGL